MSAENDSRGMLKIGEAAKRIGVNAHTLQRWHQKGEGLQPSLVTPGGHRYYSVQAVDAYCSSGENVPSTIGYLWSASDEPAERAENLQEEMYSYLRHQGWSAQVIVDRGEPSDMERSGLRDLLAHLVGGSTERLVIPEPSCLVAGGAALVVPLCEVMGIAVVHTGLPGVQTIADTQQADPDAEPSGESPPDLPPENASVDQVDAVDDATPDGSLTESPLTEDLELQAIPVQIALL